MIWAVLIACGLLIVLFQRASAGKNLQRVYADRIPEALLAEPDEPAAITVILENRGKLPVPHIAVRCGVPCSGNSEIAFTAWLLPRQQLRKTAPVTFSARGRYVLEDLHIACGDFLGLQEAEKTCGSFQEIVVPPKPLDNLTLNTLLGGFLGDISARRFIMEDPVLTLGYREYTGSEPMKRIAWNQSARHGTLMVRQNDYTIDPSVSILLNVETDLPDSAAPVEACFRAARTVCALLEEKGIRYSFSSNAVLSGKKHDNSGVTGLGRGHFGAILEVLGRARPEPAFPLETLLEQELQQAGRSGRILITPGGSEENTRLLLRMSEAEGLLIIHGREVMP